MPALQETAVEVAHFPLENFRILPIVVGSLGRKDSATVVGRLGRKNSAAVVGSLGWKNSATVVGSLGRTNSARHHHGGRALHRLGAALAFLGDLLELIGTGSLRARCISCSGANRGECLYPF